VEEKKEDEVKVVWKLSKGGYRLGKGRS